MIFYCHNLDTTARYTDHERRALMEHVLIVEDEPRLRGIVQDYFSAHGLECDLARDLSLIHI